MLLLLIHNNKYFSVSDSRFDADAIILPDFILWNEVVFIVGYNSMLMDNE